VPNMESMIETEQVRCLTFETLFKEIGIENVDLLQVDAEGFDAQTFDYATVRDGIDVASERLRELIGTFGNGRVHLVGHSLGGLVAYAVALGAPARVGKLIVASADAHRPPGRESAPLDEDRMPTPADFQAMRDAYDAVAPDPAHFDQFAARTSAMVHEFPGWTEELRSLQVPTLLIFGDRDFSPLPDVVEIFGLLPDAQLAVLPGTTHLGVTRRPGQVLALITPFLDAP